MKERISRIIVLCLAVCLLAASCDLKISDTPVTDVVEQESFYTISYFSDADETEPYLVDKSLYLIQPGTYPHKEGFYVSGWTLVAGSEEPVTTWGTELSGNISLYPIWVEDVTSYRFEGTGTETDPFLIDEAEDLVYLASLVNDGNSFDGKYLKVVADIDMSAATEWTPIGVYNNANPLAIIELPFRGVFDGDNYTITLPSVDYQNWEIEESFGLFGLVSGENAVIKNLKIGGNIEVNGESVALLAGTLSGGAAIEKCQTVTGSSVTGYEAGGFVGRARGASNILECVNNASVIATGGKAGGIACCLYYPLTGSEPFHFVSGCSNYGEITGVSYTGGLVGLATGVQFSDCANGSEENKPNVSASRYLGGITGDAREMTSIDRCFNYGNILITDGDNAIIGGIAGNMRDCSISNSANHGIISIAEGNNTDSVVEVGGIVGWFSGEQIENCQNYSPIDFDSSVKASQIGGIAGITKGETLILANLNNTGNISGTSYVAGVVGMEQSASVLFDSCDNNGDVSRSNTDVLTNYLGGIVGSVSHVNGKAAFNQVTNKGAVTSNGHYAGGIIGSISSRIVTMDTVYNSGKILVSKPSSGENVNYIGGISGNISTQNVELSVLTDLSNSETVTAESSTYVGGLFGKSGNITVKTSTNTGEVSGNSNTGGLIGRNDGNLNLDDVKNKGTVKTNAGTVGGLVGQLYDESGAVVKVSILSSNNSGTITAGGAYAGGHVGLISAKDGNPLVEVSISGSDNSAVVSSTGSYIGGLVGNSKGKLTISGSSNTGDITGPSYAGGILGSNTGSASGASASLYDVHNEGAIICPDETTFARNGGIVGNTGAEITIVNASNSGAVKGVNAQYLGGIIGLVDTTKAVSISGSNNTGELTGKNFVGGIISSVYQPAPVTVENCGNTGNINATLYSGGIIGRFMKTGENSVIKDCVSTFTLESPEGLTSKTGGGGYNGAIVGLIQLSGGDVTIEGCKAENAEVKGSFYLGGLVGAACSLDAENVWTITLKDCTVSNLKISETASSGLAIGSAYGQSGNKYKINCSGCTLGGNVEKRFASVASSVVTLTDDTATI